MESVQPARVKPSTATTLSNHGAMVCISLLGIFFFFGTLTDLVRFSWKSATYSHIVLIPLVTLGLIFSNRQTVFARSGYSPAFGLPFIGLALILVFIAGSSAPSLPPNDALALPTFAAVVFWVGAFLAAYGRQAAKEALFPLAFLIFMVPFPTSLQEMVVSVLRWGSLESAYWVFSVLGVPLLREGSVLNIPGLSLDVAPQCSGIRSGLSLFIVSLLCGHFFLRTIKNKILLAVSAIFIAMFKNGLRIVTLGMLAVHVNMKILDGDLHQKGGYPFFILAFLMLSVVMWGLRRWEKGS